MKIFTLFLKKKRVGKEKGKSRKDKGERKIRETLQLITKDTNCKYINQQICKNKVAFIC